MDNNSPKTKPWFRDQDVNYKKEQFSSLHRRIQKWQWGCTRVMEKHINSLQNLVEFHRFLSALFLTCAEVMIRSSGKFKVVTLTSKVYWFLNINHALSIMQGNTGGAAASLWAAQWMVHQWRWKDRKHHFNHPSLFDQFVYHTKTWQSVSLPQSC